MARLLPSLFPSLLYRKHPQKHISATSSNAPTVAEALISNRPEYFLLAWLSPKTSRRQISLKQETNESKEYRGKQKQCYNQSIKADGSREKTKHPEKDSYLMNIYQYS